MELTYLYYFKVIAEKENMSRAAEILHVSQPALSKAVSKLEAGLGVSLFERRKGRIYLSPVGMAFYQQVEKAFSCLDEGQRRIDAYKQRIRSTVAIGAPAAELMDALILSYLRRAAPENPPHIDQFVYSPETLQEQLLGGKLDFALTPTPFRSSDLSQMKLMDEEIVLLVGKSHPLAGEPFVRLEDLKNQRFVVSEASFDRRAVIDSCKMAGFTPTITLCSNEPGIISAALESGHGVSMVPVNVFYKKHREGLPVVALRFSDVKIARFISIASRKDRILPEGPKRLYQFAMDYFRSYGETLWAFANDYFPSRDFGPRQGIGLSNALLPTGPWTDGGSGSEPPAR